MTDHHTPSRTRRVAGALLALTTSVLPIALWTAEPAAAAGPLDITSDGCTITATGTGYEELSLFITYGISTREIAESTSSSLTATYGSWLVPAGATATATVKGFDGSSVDEMDITIPGCDTGAYVHLTAVDLGTADPAASTYGVGLTTCSAPGFLTVIPVAAGSPATVPVPPGVEYCGDVATFTVHEDLSGFTLQPERVAVATGATENMVVEADWISTRVGVYKRWYVGGQLVDDAPAGVNPSNVTFDVASYDDTGAEIFDTNCFYDAPGLDCAVLLRVRPGGTLEVTEYGAPGWTLHQTTFDESDCTYVQPPGETYTACVLELVNVPTGGSVPPPPQPAPQEPAEVVCDPAAANPFTDVVAGGPHSANVVCAADLGLLVGGPQGLPADQFGPTLTTSRAQLATLVRNLLLVGGVVLPQGAPDAFADDDGSVHEASIDQLAALGVIGGNGEDSAAFFPSRPATRSEIASFLARAYEHVAGAPLPAGSDAFGDDDGDPAEDAINALAAAGIVTGKAPGVFDPTATVTREQVASLFVQLLASV